MSAHFLDIKPSLSNQWRAIILFGRNSASYKFALAEALLTFESETEIVQLDELALPYAKTVCRHLADAPKQTTNASSSFLRACRRWNDGEIDDEQLRDATVRHGYNNVIDAFHNLSSRELPVRFFADERQTSKGIRCTDALYQLLHEQQSQDLLSESEARWRLVETAWGLGLNSAVVAFDPNTEELRVNASLRRKSITSCRDALNGYQKGSCFYCFAPISITLGDALLADVDHFLPHASRVHLGW